MNGDRNYTGAAGKISDHLRSKCILKIYTEGDKTRCAGSLLQYITARTEKAPLLRRRRLGPCSNQQMCPRSPARGGRRKKSGGLGSISPLKILKARWLLGCARESIDNTHVKGSSLQSAVVSLSLSFMRR